AFAAPGALTGVEPFPSGHIHDSYIATFRHDRGASRYLLQNLNTSVFPDPAAVMENVERVTGHLARALAGDPAADRRALALVRTRDGATWHRDAAARVWRMYRFIEGAVSRATARNAADAAAAGAAFGRFQRQLADLPGPRLRETIPDFHHTPSRFVALEAAVAADRVGRAGGVADELAALRRERHLAAALLDPCSRGELPERIAHNDAKLDNILFDTETGEALCVVDLDTVMPGLGLYDFGDLVRSMGTSAAEDERDLSRVRLEPTLIESLARGYLRETRELLTFAERALLVTSARVIVFEQAVRFLTDHLDGDRYYRVSRPGHNLDRARTQLALLAELDRAAAGLERSLGRL
ncbi:MAG TPA: aminoglycoside phosphotransferase family protein, partial [Gemmatimonadales bacterium]